MTPESHSPTGTGEPLLEPPPGCPAHGLGPGGLHRLHEAEDLEELYEKLREQHGPVAPALLHDDVPMWVVLGHAENLHMVSTPSQFCRDSRIWTPLNEGMVKPDHPLMPHIAWQPICSHAEGDEHKRLRGAVTSAMSDLDYRELRRHIKRYTQRVVNRFCEEGRADLVSQFAEHLPMGVMCHLLGMPEEYNDRLVEAARDTLKGTETAIASHAYVMEALGRLTATRRADPADDIAGRLVTHPAGLTDDEVREHLRVVLLAAYEATVNLIGNVMRVVLTDPGFRAQLSGGQMTVPQAVEQSLWDEPPFSTVFAYFAKQETELGGQRIRAGDGLLLGIAPGNVDPRIRPDLDASMMGNRAHLAFGGGPHECPGQDIGRAIADAGIDALLMRLPDLQLDCDEDDLRWRSSIASRHLVELPVRFEPRAQQDIMQQPSHAPTPERHAPWHVGLPKPERRAQPPLPTQPPQPVSVTAAEPQQAPGAGQPRPRGAWQRFLLWWRGY
ncbi:MULTISPECIES: cytochrome P450 [Streptomyces]|uniref:cytochrome P450 n=1 Tax=Streptomyces TaxID=1883 RepID=UPI0004CC1ACD|nr:MULTISPECIES: cytochrome P450 [Streptomyces]MDX3345230.1 cytochrome P450 [Streptomyces sp. ME02-6979A]PSK54406.1 2-hydroxy-5-methyl-1-naphthoate 7-hydroxylase [Streptomyces sp. 111WW2]WSB64255.1 cytochrome P450 [Streptomyces anthocyanicus]WTC51943.1 cytochrome P450 [Streptomyces anthocyanicus]GHA39188.1 cytochrome P450 [Streptomyces anthocyanicus]